MTLLEIQAVVSDLLSSLCERGGELTEAEHVCVMEAFNEYAELDQFHGPTDEVNSGNLHELVQRTVEALATLIDLTPDRSARLQYARVRALLVASRAA